MVRINAWSLNQPIWALEGNNAISLSSNQGTYLFNVKQLTSQDLSIRSTRETDLFLKMHDNQLFIYSLGIQKQTLTVLMEDRNKKTTRTLKPGELWKVSMPID